LQGHVLPQKVKINAKFRRFIHMGNGSQKILLHFRRDKAKERSIYIMAHKQHELKNEQMQMKKAELRELEANLQNYKQQLEDKEDEVKTLENSIGASRIRKERALELFEGLSGEEQKWVYFNRILAKVSFRK